MCLKKLKEILFPTNVLGKNKRCVTFDTSGTPVVDDKKTFTIVWAGEALQVSYTQQRSGQISYTFKKYTPIKELYTGGGTETLEAPEYATIHSAVWISNDILYFNCTNVTSLVVNGDQII